MLHTGDGDGVPSCRLIGSPLAAVHCFATKLAIQQIGLWLTSEYGS